VPPQTVGSRFLRYALRICECIHALASPNTARSCNIRASETVLLDVSKEAQNRGFEISKSLAQGLTLS
jgi:hypothetical protein